MSTQPYKGLSNRRPLLSTDAGGTGGTEVCRIHGGYEWITINYYGVIDSI